MSCSLSTKNTDVSILFRKTLLGLFWYNETNKPELQYKPFTAKTTLIDTHTNPLVGEKLPLQKKAIKKN